VHKTERRVRCSGRGLGTSVLRCRLAPVSRAVLVRVGLSRRVHRVASEYPDRVGQDVEDRVEGFGRAALRAGKVDDECPRDRPGFTAREAGERGFLKAPQTDQFRQPAVAALENVELPLVYAKGGVVRGKAEAALKRVGLEDRASHFSSELSGGQQQRVAIARALVNDPEVLFADEPTGNLDTASGEEVMQIFEELNGRGKTVILITHEADVAARAERVVRIVDGEIVSDEKLAKAASAVSNQTVGDQTVGDQTVGDQAGNDQTGNARQGNSK